MKIQNTEICLVSSTQKGLLMTKGMLLNNFFVKWLTRIFMFRVNFDQDDDWLLECCYWLGLNIHLSFYFLK